jgi:hypothetical protein
METGKSLLMLLKNKWIQRSLDLRNMKNKGRTKDWAMEKDW